MTTARGADGPIGGAAAGDAPAGAAGPAGGPPVHPGRLVVGYTLGRLAVFCVLTGVLFGIGAGIVALAGHSVDADTAKPLGLAAAFVAAPLSMLVSYVVLARQRVAVTELAAARIERYRARAAARTAAEDAYAERLAAERSGRPPAD